VSLLANQYSIQRSSCATTLIGTTKQQHIVLGTGGAEEPIDEEMLADVAAAVGPDRGRHWMCGLPQNN
jgi:L-galactose dehydrogenase